MLPSVLSIVAAATGVRMPNFGPDFVPSTLDNMNGEYIYSTTPGGTPGMMPKQYRDYPGGAEAYDVYSGPVSTLYSQVWWTALAPTAFPDGMVRKYNGSKVAIVGWEIDQVRRTPKGDISVPISASYNHHFVATMIGAGARFKKISLNGPDDPRAAPLRKQCHGMLNWEQPQYVVEELAGSSSTGATSNAQFSSANGGEYRKSYHGFPPGFALVLDSPTEFQFTPMQIDTWNREKMNISGPLPPAFVAGPEPAASLASPGSSHSGLLECPMTSRLTKEVDVTYAIRTDSCATPILSFQECFAAAAKTLSASGQPPLAYLNTTGSDPHRPVGCSVVLVDEVAKAGLPTPMTLTARVYFNRIVYSTAPCGSMEKLPGSCVCSVNPPLFGQIGGVLMYHANASQAADVGSGTADRFSPGKCAPSPATTILEQRNPTCDIRNYQGGQWACHHMWSLLDKEQPIPWADQPLVFQHKWRFWVQPYDPSYHTALTLGESVGSAILLGSPWEYDVPQCGQGVPGCSWECGTVSPGCTWVHTVTGSHMGQHTFVAFNPHCHAPTCLQIDLYTCDKGTALDQCNATTGKLACRVKPVYGDAGNPAIQNTRFSEPGFIAIPDCFWGKAENGLEPPLNLTDVPLHVVKKCNATEGHYGEMSGGQPWVIV